MQLYSCLRANGLNGLGRRHNHHCPWWIGLSIPAGLNLITNCNEGKDNFLTAFVDKKNSSLSDHEVKNPSLLNNNPINNLPEVKLPEGKKTFQCTTCKASFEDRRSCNAHIEFVHEGKKPFLNQDSLSKQDIAQLYVSAIHERKRHMCEICGKHYAYKRGLKNHIARHHENAGKPYTQEREQGVNW